jgi:hypothetical protein
LNETARSGIARAAGAKERAINNQESDTIVRDPSRVRQGGRLSQSSREGISSFYGWLYKHHRASPNPEQILVKTKDDSRDSSNTYVLAQPPNSSQGPYHISRIRVCRWRDTRVDWLREV